MNDLPDRVCADEKSPFHHPKFRSIGIRFNGEVRQNDVQEYCVSKGWIKKQIKLPNGKLKLERGKPVTILIRGQVEVFWR